MDKQDKDSVWLILVGLAAVIALGYLMLWSLHIV